MAEVIQLSQQTCETEHGKKKLGRPRKNPPTISPRGPLSTRELAAAEKIEELLSPEWDVECVEKAQALIRESSTANAIREAMETIRVVRNKYQGIGKKQHVLISFRAG